jgi:hypothetical protein
MIMRTGFAGKACPSAASGDHAAVTAATAHASCNLVGSGIGDSSWSYGFCHRSMHALRAARAQV